MALEWWQFLGRFNVPNANEFIGSCGPKSLSVDMERQRGHGPGIVSLSDVKILSLGHVPDFDSAIVAGRGKVNSVVAKGHAMDLVRVSLEAGQLYTGLSVPQTHSLIKAGGGKAFAVGTEDHITNLSG